MTNNAIPIWIHTTSILKGDLDKIKQINPPHMQPGHVPFLYNLYKDNMNIQGL